jgi:quinol monooxygenase YgiN
MIAIAAFVPACAPSDEVPGPAAEPEATPAPASAKELPPVAVLIVHRVADFDAWKPVFDDHAEARKAAGFLGHYLEREVGDPNMVSIYFPAMDSDAAKAFLTSSDLAQAMQRAGVEGSPRTTLMKPMSLDEDERLLPAIVIDHPVADYDTWRAAYDAFDAQRRDMGIVGHAVNQELGNPNRVVVYHQAEDVETLRAFVESTELRETMERAGVVGEPEIMFVEPVEGVDY